MNELALFAGAGGGILGGAMLGWRTVCAVELDPYARDVLVARQNDGSLPPFPVWDDIRDFDGRPWRGAVDVVSGGFPCQDISAAGKGAGIGGRRSGLWSEMARVIGEVRPGHVLVENSPLLVKRGLGLVLLDLARLGYDARWGIVGARDAGAPHRRDRIWIAARNISDPEHSGLVRYRQDEPKRERQEVGRGQQPRRNGCDWPVADAAGERGGAGSGETETQRGRTEPTNCGGDRASETIRHSQEPRLERPEPTRSACADGRIAEHGHGRWEPDWWAAEPDVGRVAHGVAARVDRLRCIGNGQVPQALRLAWGILTGGWQR